MTFDEFMQLPLDSRKKIEQAMVDLDKAIQAQYEFSMFDTEKRLMRRVNAPETDAQPQKDGRGA